MRHRHYILLVSTLAYLVGTNILWIARDTRPPYWDMAAHATAGLRIHDAFAASGLRALSTAFFIPAPYPPLFHSVVALFYAAFGRTIDAAQWANIPAIVLLVLATYSIGRTLFTPLAAAAGATVAGFFPFLLWLSRETVIDYWLTALTAVAIWAMLQTQEFSRPGWSAIFGIVCALGMLTKWTFVFFVLLPALWTARKNLRNAMIAAAIAGGIAACWYLPAAGSLGQLLQFNSAQSLLEGDPDRFSLQSLVFYLRALEGSQLFLPLFGAFVGGALLLPFQFNRRWIPIVLWLGGGWAGMLLFQNKDPRYIAPLLPAIALITAVLFEKRDLLVAAVLPLLVFQHYLVSFGIPLLPPAVVLASGGEGPVHYDWNLYTQHYFGWGAAAAEDWKIEHVLDALHASADTPRRLGIVPDIARFDTLAFEFVVGRDRRPIAISRLALLDETAIADEDFVLLSEKETGFDAGSGIAPDMHRIREFIEGHPDRFTLQERITLPNGDVVQLFAQH